MIVLWRLSRAMHFLHSSFENMAREFQNDSLSLGRNGCADAFWRPMPVNAMLFPIFSNGVLGAIGRMAGRIGHQSGYLLRG
jgi:hypothetical protein